MLFLLLTFPFFWVSLQEAPRKPSAAEAVVKKVEPAKPQLELLEKKVRRGDKPLPDFVIESAPNVHPLSCW